MDHPEVEPIEVTLNGRLYVLARQVVEARLVDVTPVATQEPAALVNGEWFPARQALALALGVPEHAITVRAARAKLAALGFQTRRPPRVSDSEPAVEVASARPTSARAPRREAEGRPAPAGGPAGQANRTSDPGRTEADVQAAVVAALTTAGWDVRSTANTATKEQGIDIVAEREGQTVGVEVKGFPGQNHPDPARTDRRKRTRPSNQAGHWYAQAILAAMRLRGTHPDWRSVIALPDHPRYRTLHTQTVASLSAAAIELWWVDSTGEVSGL